MKRYEDLSKLIGPIVIIVAKEEKEEKYKVSQIAKHTGLIVCSDTCL